MQKQIFPVELCGYKSWLDWTRESGRVLENSSVLFTLFLVSTNCFSKICFLHANGCANGANTLQKPLESCNNPQNLNKLPTNRTNWSKSCPNHQTVKKSRFFWKVSALPVETEWKISETNVIRSRKAKQAKSWTPDFHNSRKILVRSCFQIGPRWSIPGRPTPFIVCHVRLHPQSYWFMASTVSWTYWCLQEALHQSRSSEYRFLSSFHLLLEIWIGITPRS